MRGLTSDADMYASMRSSHWQRIFCVSLLMFSLALAQICDEDCAHPKNTIIRENCKLGNDSRDWDVNADGDQTIQGFSKPFTVNQGEKIDFKIKTDSQNYRIDIYRVGWYAGLGARHVDTIKPTASLPQLQPDCIREAATLLFDCDNWGVSATWHVPQSAVSGVYLARLIRQDGQPTWRADNSQYGADRRFSYPDETPGKMAAPPQKIRHAYGALGHGRLANALREPQASLIYFVVREDASRSSMIFQTSDTTWQAYNLYGGANTYYALDPPYRRAYKVSYNRPFQTRATRAVNILFGAEYPMIRWLESNGYDLSYQSGIDTHRNPTSQLVNHKIFLSVGHDEYWSGQQRKNVEDARDSGLNLAFFSGNEVFWRTRWENDYRHLVVYKESQARSKIDPNITEWTGTFRDSRSFNPIGARPENALTGTIFTVNAWRHDALEVPSAFSKLRFWRNTSIQNLANGQKKVIKPGLLGHEWDEDIDNGFRPAGLVRLSRTTINNLWMVQDFIVNCDSGTGTHSLVIYRAASGALVFGAGTVQWSWGLDSHRDTETGVPPERANPTNIRVGVDQMGSEPDIEQATLNLFTDMGVNPQVEKLKPELVKPNQTTDRIPPKVYSSQQSIVTKETHIDLFGEALDEDGVLGAVEYSIDDGLSWHVADFQENLHTGSYSWKFTLKSVRHGSVTQLELDSGSVVGAALDEVHVLGEVPEEDLYAEVLVRAVDDSYNIGQPIVIATKFAV